MAPVETRFPDDVAAALREHPMRRMETRSLYLYYPAGRRDEARRVAERLEGCVTGLHVQARIRNGYSQQKIPVILPETPLNNAFVLPPLLGYEEAAVIPTTNTLDLALELGMPPDPSFVGCHEMVHAVQMHQVSGIWASFNWIFGDLLTPQIGLDPWFSEGLATYYESQMQPGSGRMAWPAWRGMFAAAFAGRAIGGGDFSAYKRPFHWGNHYLVGSFFVEFVADRYGSDDLWRLVQSQGDSFLFPLFVAMRFRAIGGKSLPALIDEFSDWARARFPVRPRPAEQRRVRGAGESARYAVAADGSEALVTASGDQPARLRVYGPDGRPRQERNLTDILPPRDLAVAAPILVSGLSFTADGRTLWLTAIDLGATEQEARLLRYDVAADRMTVILPRLGGIGGGISPDGGTYYYSYADGDRHVPAALDVRTGKARLLRDVPPRTHVSGPRPSPDGSRVVASVWDGTRYAIWVIDVATGRLVATIDPGRAVTDASFADDGHVLFVAEHDGRFQVQLHDLATGKSARVTDAPYLAMAPRARSGAVRFLDREGWRWEVDEAPMAALPDAAAPPPDAPLPELPYAGPGGATAPADPDRITADAAPAVVSDDPYSQLDHLFYPSARGLVALAPEGEASLLGLVLGGGDRLGYHRWSIYGAFQRDADALSGGVDYATTLLAPLVARASLSQTEWVWHESLPKRDYYRRQRQASLSLERRIRTATVALSAQAVEDIRHPEDVVAPNEPAGERMSRRLGGPRLELGWSGVESTPYAGARRGLAVSASAAWFDQALSTLPDSFADVRGTLAVVTPLPLSPRHTLTLSLRGRALAGLTAGTGLLQVGGVGPLATLWQGTTGADNPEFDAPTLPPQVSFVEPLRGFEDLAIEADRIAIGEVTYRYPIIIDHGFASTLYLLPSWFFRELDLELFAAGATDTRSQLADNGHLAAGASLSLFDRHVGGAARGPLSGRPPPDRRRRRGADRHPRHQLLSRGAPGVETSPLTAAANAGILRIRVIARILRLI